MALKTLKDIEPGIAFSGKEVKELGFKFSDMKKVEFIQGERDKNIKQEAIKWIKADKSNYHSRQGKFETILWIKHFFNITDEDLKDTLILLLKC